jgi:molecular chaperone DnaK (HSP70)
VNCDKGKAPTKIAYSPAACSDDKLQTNVAWGYGIGDAEAAEWFKLLLLDEEDMDRRQRQSPQIRRARLLLQRAGKSPVQAVADYLRLLWAHAIGNITKDLGESAVEGLPFRIVLTVPAVWTQKAVSRMRQAADGAGILCRRTIGETTLHFVSEPEAAALATFDDLKERPNFQQDDTFLVCDAGGGTVDLSM